MHTSIMHHTYRKKRTKTQIKSNIQNLKEIKYIVVSHLLVFLEAPIAANVLCVSTTNQKIHPDHHPQRQRGRRRDCDHHSDATWLSWCPPQPPCWWKIGTLPETHPQPSLVRVAPVKCWWSQYWSYPSRLNPSLVRRVELSHMVVLLHSSIHVEKKGRRVIYIYTHTHERVVGDTNQFKT